MASRVPSSSSRRPKTNEGAIGSFLIEREIGKGSFATVFRGTHAPTQSLVAIKSVNLSKLNKKLKDNLYCEIEILKGLHHPHIVALLDCRETTSHIHLMMEFCELGDLSYFIKKRDKLADNPTLVDMIRKYPMPAEGGLNEVIVRHFFKQLASAMEFLRDRGFIHRDVKPQNLLLLPSPDWMAKHKNVPELMTASKEPIIPMVGLNSLPMLKLADFGFARSLPSTSLAETLCGSPLYMAPEILRYEKYDARADLWSIGTVLYEMMTGRPPFRASNHVELLRRIEQNEDGIRFSSKATISRDMKDIVRGLLKRKPDDRITFQDFFAHPVVVGPIPGLVGEDRPREIMASSRSEDAPLARHSSLRDRRPVDRNSKHIEVHEESSNPRAILSSSPRSPRTPNLDSTSQGFGTPARPGSSGRPSMVPSATAPNMETVQSQRDRAGRLFNPMSKPRSRQQSYDEVTHAHPPEEPRTSDSITEAEQAVRDARDYVLVEKRAIEVNALADELAANPQLTHARQMAKQMPTRRHTSMGTPTSTTGAVAIPHSRAVQRAQGNARPDSSGRNSYGRSYGSGSPSTASAIAKALQGASVRVFGVSWSPTLIGKGPSPPQLYNPYPAYPTPNAGLINDSRPIDEDQRVVNAIEDSATRSDVVYGFAEVKFRQLIPLAPSMDHGLGGPNEKAGDIMDEDDGLTVEAIVSLSEEALLLYVKSLSLLAKSMDIAGAWWSRKNRGEVVGGVHTPKSEPQSAIATSNRINRAVQWVRSRFNEVLEKAEFVRSKLIDAQKRLPEDHPGHPSNHTSASKLSGTSATDGVFFSSGITAEKLMYDRALEMSRTAAINELANEDHPGCEISYTTAIRMLEAILENDEDLIPRKRSSSLREDKDKEKTEGEVNGILVGDRKDVLKVLQMIRTRLHVLQKKMALMAQHQNLPPPSSPRHSHSGGTTPTIANTPPH
ncbi:Serine threonine- kinase atg1 protein [Rutstroemia sp. NJR-2017a BBW]|nr:Serine threonine- kinase atg1 protein [Rutstroemia sp. NJR-2017a BBW]